MVRRGEGADASPRLCRQHGAPWHEPPRAVRDYTGGTTCGGWCHMSSRLRRSVMSAVLGGAVATGLLLGAATPAAAVETDPADGSPDSVQLAETGAGDRALIGLGIAGGVLLLGGAVTIAVTPRRNTDG